MNDLAALLTTWGRDLGFWTLRTNASTLVLLSMAMLAERLLQRRVRASYRIALYVPLVLRVLLPEALEVAVPRGTQAAVFLARLHPLALSSSASAFAAPMLSLPAAFAILYVAAACLLAGLWLRDRSDLRARRHGAARRMDIAHAHAGSVFVHQDLGPMIVGVVRPRVVPAGASSVPGLRGGRPRLASRVRALATPRSVARRGDAVAHHRGVADHSAMDSLSSNPRAGRACGRRRSRRSRR